MSPEPPAIPPRSWAEINLDALRHNARIALARAEGAELMAVVKGDAYGHGLEHVVPVLAPFARYFAVASALEAARVEAILSQTPGGPHPDLFLLGSSLPGERQAAAAHGWHLSVSSLEEIQACALLGREFGRPVAVHLVADTGMGRIGFLESEFLSAVESASRHPQLRVAGLATHLPSAAEDEPFTHAQIRRADGLFRAALEILPHPVSLHLHNSAALLLFPPRGVQLVRPGLLLYGVSPGSKPEPGLEPVMSFHTRVTLVRSLPAGHGVSYGRTWIASRPVRVATLGVGYADGYPRQLSSSGAEILIGGVRCPLLGRVTMDQIVVDVSSLRPEPRPGDEAILFGCQGQASCPVEEIAFRAGTISWEILTRLTARPPRIPREQGEFLGQPPLQR
ncbi:MAG TPA: alanine racemase [Verrucomicrobiales bacterium]|nr:alanine racemase [Verrucomicrobiales bacterium]